MQRDTGRVRCDSWGRLFREPKLFACAVVSLTFHVALYGFGFWSCRPGGNMWHTIAAQEGGAPEMQGTWLGLPLAMIHRPLEDLSNSTCGGTTNGQRPEPDWDTWVCYPREDIRAEESYTIWKQSLPALLVLMVLFLLLGKITEENESGRVGFRCVFGIIVVGISHGLIGTVLIAGMGAGCMALSRALRNASPEVALATVWCFVLICMETVFRLLGAHTHAVPGWRHDQGFKSWCLLESLVCGDVLNQPVRNSSVCSISNAFILKGLAPWISFRFMALKLISLAFDDLWSYKELPSGVRNLESKPELIRRAETNLPPEKYSWRYIVAYLGYAPLFFAGPILSYNAFVSQLEKKQETYRGRQ
ncbi:gup1, partial [Symbiodinium sp. CCMP2456]